MLVDILRGNLDGYWGTGYVRRLNKEPPRCNRLQNAQERGKTTEVIHRLGTQGGVIEATAESIG